MPKTIFHTSEKSNFILNMDLDKYRRFCAKLLAAMLICVAFAEMMFQLTYSKVIDFNEMIADGGVDGFLALTAIGLRSVATFFSVLGVFVVITMVIGVMRQQFSRSTAVPYCIVLALLGWAVVSVLHSFSISDSMFGQDGRDEGWFALLIYGATLYVGSMLRREENLSKLMNFILGFSVVQCIWGLLQACPFFDFPNEYKFVGPLVCDNLKLPSGFTDSPITFAMLLSMLACIAIPAAVCSKSKFQRVFATICVGLEMLLLLKTQTYAGVIGAACALLFGIVMCAVYGKKSAGKTWVLPVVLAGALVVSAGWTYFTPSINDVSTTTDKIPVDDGFRFLDGALIFDDGNYRISTCPAYNVLREHDFDINDACSVLKFSWKEGIKAIKKYPVLGTGPDNFFYTQMHSSYVIISNDNGVDRPYNDFLFIAATRGILSLILYLALLVICLVKGFRHHKETGNWVYLSAAFAVLAYTATSMVGISVLTVTPLLWAMLGVLIGTPLTDAPKDVSATH